MEIERTIVIASTFSAEPVADSVHFWLERMEMRAQVRFAPQFQLIQALLDPTGGLRLNAAGLNVVLLRWEDLHRSDASMGALNEIATAIRACSAEAKVPHLIVLCPASLEATRHDRIRLYSEWDHQLGEELESCSTVWITATAELRDLYPVDNPHDSYGDKLALLPYSPEMFAAIGTVIARKFHLSTTSPYKAIVTDCDGTLWEGVCGEDGAHGIRVDAPRRVFQEFLVAQSELGALVCLCSKNEDEDVKTVFRMRTEMPLQLQHIAAHRINWAPKAENLLSIAQELGAATDSFIYLDDNPVECEMMRQALPNVLTLQLPLDIDQIPAFLRRVWAFDRPRATKEDKNRTTSYQATREREQLRDSSATVEEFLAGLNLTLKFVPIDGDNLARASQLTFRVNQFNFTTIRRTEAELAVFLREESRTGLLMDVSDRFGDYGLVGLILFSSHSGVLEIDSFLLSCRALGRGVEHRMFAELATLAQSKGLNTIVLTLYPTARNQPARDFIDDFFASYRSQRDGYVEYRVPISFAHALPYIQGRAKEPSAEEQDSSQVPLAVDGASAANRASTHAWIASEASDASKIWTAVQDWKRKDRVVPEGDFAPWRTGLEEQLVGIWAEVLGLDKVGVRDNFFELGGDSLSMIKVIVRIYAQFGIEFPVDLFFNRPTIEEHAIELRTLAPGDVGGVGEIE